MASFGCAAELKVGMVISPEYADLILAGKKVAEIRPERIQNWQGEALTGQTIGIIGMTMNKVLGEAKIIQIKQLTQEEYRSAEWTKRHCITKGNLQLYAQQGKDIYAYMLERPVKYATPVDVKWKGSQVFVTLTNNEYFKRSLQHLLANTQAKSISKRQLKPSNEEKPAKTSRNIIEDL